jgi:diguanylate cyclase (GGDEF)-like protein/PAS domain S-box-containing protein
VLQDEIEELLQQPGARIVAFDPMGGRTLPLPPELEAVGSEISDGESPLSAVDPASMGKAVATFERARRQGRAGTTLRLLDDDYQRHLELLDATDEFGCFIGVSWPVVGENPRAGSVVDVAPRRALYDVSVTGLIETVTPEFTAMLGWTAEQVVGTSTLELIHPDDHEAAVVTWIEVMDEVGNSARTLRRYRKASGDWLWCEATNQNNLDDPDRPVVQAEIVDVSREMAAQAALQHREALLDRLSRALPTGVLYFDHDGQPAFQNDRWKELTGLEETEGVGSILDLIEEREEVQAAWDQAVEDGTDVDLEVSLSTGAGQCRYGALHFRPVREDHGHVGLLLTLDDMTAVRQYQNQLADQSRRDPMTSVLNRRGIEEVLESRLADRRGGLGPVAVLFIDLDRFKAINDTHGHAVGDEVLCQTGETVTQLLRPSDALGRIGGDEFIVVLSGDTSLEHAAQIADRIKVAVCQLVDQFDIDMEVSATVGFALAEDGDDFDSIIKRADTAMYQGKQEREDQVEPVLRSA